MLIRACTKPDAKEFKKIATATIIGHVSAHLQTAPQTRVEGGGLPRVAGAGPSARRLTPLCPRACCSQPAQPPAGAISSAQRRPFCRLAEWAAPFGLPVLVAAFTNKAARSRPAVHRRESSLTVPAVSLALLPQVPDYGLHWLFREAHPHSHQQHHRGWLICRAGSQRRHVAPPSPTCLHTNGERRAPRSSSTPG